MYKSNKIELDVDNVVVYRDTPWDKNVLTIKTNEILNINYQNYSNLQKLLHKFEKFSLINKYGFTNVRIPYEDTMLKKLLIMNNYYFVEITYLIYNNLANIKNLFIKKEIQMFDIIKDSNIKMQIINYAENYFNFGRFFEDVNISNELARERNKNWAKNMIGNEFNIVYALSNKNELIGFMFYKPQSASSVDLILGGVGYKFRHYALFFWQGMFNYFINKGFNEVRTTISAGNVGVLNLYNYFDFKVEKAFAGFHKFRELSYGIKKN